MPDVDVLAGRQQSTNSVFWNSARSTLKSFNVFCCLEVADVDSSLSIGGLINTIDVLREDLVGWTAEISWVGSRRSTHLVLVM